MQLVVSGWQKDQHRITNLKSPVLGMLIVPLLLLMLRSGHVVLDSASHAVQAVMNGEKGLQDTLLLTVPLCPGFSQNIQWSADLSSIQ